MGSRLEARFFRTTVAPTESAKGFVPRALNQLPIRVVDDYPVGGELKRRGGVIVPLVDGDACRIELRVHGGAVAARVGAGKINALSGEAWNDRVPPQPGEHLCVRKPICIDGFLASGGNAQQFVAHPMGFGSTAEERETGSAIWGGLQIQAIPMTEEALSLHLRDIDGGVMHDIPAFAPRPTPLEPLLLGFGRGGSIKQHLLLDTFEPDAWNLAAAIRCFVTIMDQSAFESLTGEIVGRLSTSDVLSESDDTRAQSAAYKVPQALASYLRVTAKSKKE